MGGIQARKDTIFYRVSILPIDILRTMIIRYASFSLSLYIILYFIYKKTLPMLFACFLGDKWGDLRLYGATINYALLHISTHWAK